MRVLAEEYLKDVIDDFENLWGLWEFVGTPPSSWSHYGSHSSYHTLHHTIHYHHRRLATINDWALEGPKKAYIMLRYSPKCWPTLHTVLHISILRLYLGYFELVINLIYSTLFTYIPLPKFNQWDSLVLLISRKGGWRQVDVKWDGVTWMCMVSMVLLYYCKKTNLFCRWYGWNNHGRGSNVV